MRQNVVGFRVLPRILLMASLLLVTTRSGMAQSTRARGHVRLPAAVAGTPLSFQIAAEANYLAGRGDLIESVAVARKINAEAVAREIQNSVDYVDAYFKRRELNRQWRSKENPNYLEWLGRRKKVLEKLMTSHFDEVLRGDPTDELNWLLTQLSGPTLAYSYYDGARLLADSEIDKKLRPEDVAQIWFSDGASESSRVVFSAADAKVLATQWPPALRDPKFNAARIEFQTTRDKAVEEARSKDQLGRETAGKLMGTLDRLLVLLEKAYPRQSRKEPAVFLDYNVARRYLRSLVAGVHRMIRTDDPALFDGTLRFQGDSVIDLVLHMDRTGLVFAKPPSGDKRVYRSLITQMREIWLHLGPEDPYAIADVR